MSLVAIALSDFSVLLYDQFLIIYILIESMYLIQIFKFVAIELHVSPYAFKLSPLFHIK